MTINLIINNQPVSAPDGSTVLEAAERAGIEIPTLCHHPDLTDIGACRMCVVSIDGVRGLQTACTTPAREGMIVNTMSDEAVSSRKVTLELILEDHPNDCMTCEANGQCELQDLVYDYGVKWPEHSGRRHQYEIDPDPNPFIFIDRNKCILCGRCVRACAEIQNRDVWHLAQRGFDTVLVAGADQFMLDAGCESCGQCVTYCPVGALWDKMSIGKGRLSQVEKVRTTCSYCGVGCNFDLNVRNNEIVRVTAAADAPVNGLSLCVKGHYGYDYVHHPDRLTRPLVRAKWLDETILDIKLKAGAWEPVSEAEKRNSLLTWRRQHGGNGRGNGHDKSEMANPQSEIPSPKSHITPETFIRTDWDTALDVVARKFTKTKKEYGGDAFALMASAKCTNEENYIFNKFTRQMLATHSIDHCARL